MTSTSTASNTSDTLGPLPAAEPLGDVTPRPWRRYVARLGDTLLGQAVAGVVLAVCLPGFFQTLMQKDVAWFTYLAGCAVALPLEALLLARWGTTPIKALLGLRVVRTDGAALGFDTAWRRTIEVWILGMGVGFPLASLFTMLYAKRVLERERRTVWDRDLGCEVVCVRS